MSSLEDMNAMPSAYHEGWSREEPRQFWDPSRKLLKSISTYQRLQKKNSIWVLLLRKLCVFRHRFGSVATGAEVQLNSKKSDGLLVPNTNGIIIHSAEEIQTHA